MIQWYDVGMKFHKNPLLVEDWLVCLMGRYNAVSLSLPLSRWIETKIYILQSLCNRELYQKCFQIIRYYFCTSDIHIFLSPILKCIRKIHIFPKNRGMAKRKYLADPEIVTRILNVTWHKDSLPKKTKTWLGLQRRR